MPGVLRRNNWIIWFFLAALCLLVPGRVKAEIVGSGSCGSTATWTLDDEGKLTITGRGVIWQGAFSNRDDIKTVVIGENITSIGYSAFSGCKNMTDIEFPDSLNKIIDNAFSGCSGLTQIELPKNLLSIGTFAFRNCTSLEQVVIPEGVTSIGESAFVSCQALNDVVIPSTVTTMGGWVFNGCKELESVTILGAMDTISSGMFCNCPRLSSVSMPDSVISIAGRAFEDCINLSSITLPEHLSSVGSRAFYNCSLLGTIAFPDSVSSIGESAFENCVLLSDVVIPDGLTALNTKVFKGCSSLESITIPGGITSIGSYAFADCSGLAHVTIQNGVNDIGEYAFSNCTSLVDADISGSVNSIGGYAFIGCSTLEGITIPRGVDSIGTCAFANCSSLAYAAIPDTVGSIGTRAFLNCSSLESITIPDNITSIENFTFYGCSSLSRIIIPDSVSLIDSSSFASLPDNHMFYVIKGSYAAQFCIRTFGRDHVSYLYEPQQSETNTSYFSLRYSAINIGVNDIVSLGDYLLISEDIAISDIEVSGYNDQIMMYVEDGDRIVGLREGSTVLKLSCGEEELSVTVNVVSNTAQIADIELSPSELFLREGERRGLTISVLPDSAACTGADITWSSSDETVAVVSDGVVTANAAGSATITAAYSDEITASCTVTVFIPAAKIILHDESVELVVGDTWRMGYYIYPYNTTDPAPVMFRSEDETLASVSEDGVITAFYPGTVNVWISKGDLQESIPVTVTAPLKGISLDKTREQIYKDSSVQLHVIYEPEYTTSDKTVQWTSSNDKVAAVDETGCVTALSAGVAEITARVGEYEAVFTAICLGYTQPYYTVTYSDGVDDEIFADQTTRVAEGDPTPGYQGETPERTCYLFAGWTPEIAETVTEDVTYEAVWVEHHAVKEIAGEEASCTKDGSKTYYQCEDCGKKYADPEGREEITDESTLIIPATGHAWGKVSYTWAADNSKVTAVRTCENDQNHVETEEATPTGKVTRPPSCEERGETTYSAEFENPAFLKQTKTVENIDPIGHAWGEVSYTWADDNSKVTAVRTCGNDQSHVETETAIASEVTRSPTCEESGVTTYTAEFENPAFLKQTKVVNIAPTGHAWGEVSYTWADDNSKVTAVRTCGNDQSHVETEEATPTKDTRPATCEESGLTTYTAEFENSAFLKQTKEVSIAPTGHDWVVSWRWAPDYTSANAEVSCRNNPSHRFWRTVSAVRVTTLPTCTDSGKAVFTVSLPIEGTTHTDTKTLVLPATGHEWGEVSYTWAVDNSFVTASRICSNDGSHVEQETAQTGYEVTVPADCGHEGTGTYTATFNNPEFAEQTREVAIPATGNHVWNEGSVTTQPTEISEGVRTYTCTVCNDTRTESIEKLTPPPADPPAPAPDPVLGTLTTLDAQVKTMSENGDPAGSLVGLLQLKAKKVKSTSIETTQTSYSQSGLKKGTYYKYIVAAYDSYGNIITTSKAIHIATSGGKKGNTKAVRLNKTKTSLKRGKTFKLKATLKNGKLKVSKHRKIAFESSDPTVATVTKSGKIKAISSGTCYIYAYAQNGVSARCKVTVK